MAPKGGAYSNMKEGDEETLHGQHFSIKAAMGKLVLAPIDWNTNGLRILDSGTGDGFWLQDLANDTPNPSSHHFHGTDIISSRYPTNLGQNFAFADQNITEPWPETWKGSFDLVHQRLTLAGCRRFPVEEAVRGLCSLVRAGGWIQLVEPEQEAHPEDGPKMTRFLGMIREVLQCTGMDTTYAKHLQEMFQRIGFEEVHEVKIVQLLGATNPDSATGELGVSSTGVAAEHFTRLVSTLPASMRTTMSDEELKSIVPELLEELRSRGGRYPFRVVWARRPANWQ